MAALWLPLYLLILDLPQAVAKQQRLLSLILPILIALQAGIPQNFMYGTWVYPMNCYALKVMPSVFLLGNVPARIPAYWQKRKLCGLLP